MQDSSVSRSENISIEQKEYLVNYLESHPMLSTRKFNKDFTRKDSQKLWSSLVDDLNALPGAEKDEEQWRRALHDIKKHIRKRFKIIQELKARPPAIGIKESPLKRKSLTPLEMRIYEIATKEHSAESASPSNGSTTSSSATKRGSKQGKQKRRKTDDDSD